MKKKEKILKMMMLKFKTKAMILAKNIKENQTHKKLTLKN